MKLPSFDVQALIKTVVDAIKTKVDTIETRTNTINTNIDTLLAGRVVKSVQRGNAQFGSVSQNGLISIDVPIANINVNKSVLIISCRHVQSAAINLPVTGVIKTATVISLAVVQATNNTGPYVDWQVVEFY